jgi:hypothetical protein
MVVGGWDLVLASTDESEAKDFDMRGVTLAGGKPA